MEAVNVYCDRLLSNGNCYMLNPFISRLFGPPKGYLKHGTVYSFRQMDHMVVKGVWRKGRSNGYHYVA